MKKVAFNIAKVVIPIGLGVFIIWYVFGLMDSENKKSLIESIQKAEYGLVFLSVMLGILSHASRAYRWKYLLAPLGYKPRFLNSFFSVMIGYLINLILPRVGEVTRCGIMSRYEKIPFSKLLGTVIAERIADMTILGTLIIVIIFAQLNTIKTLLLSILPSDIDTNTLIVTALVGLISTIILGIIAYQVLKRSVNTIVIKIKGVIAGFADGVKSILNMENSGMFILHTVFIWVMYTSMFYLCFFTLEETSNVPLTGVSAAFALGAVSLILVQGGIGVYPAAIMKVLLLYGVSEGAGGALGWIIWTSQTIMILSIGIFSFIAISWYNKMIKGNEQPEPDKV